MSNLDSDLGEFAAIEGFEEALEELDADLQRSVADHEWVREHGEEVARSIIELLHAAGFEKEIKASDKQAEEVEERKPRAKRPQQKRPAHETFDPRTASEDTFTNCMRYVEGECSPGKSDGKAKRPSTMPRNGSHYVSRTYNGESPGWHNIVRIYEDGLDPSQ